jgi:hypothetical protein
VGVAGNGRRLPYLDFARGVAAIPDVLRRYPGSSSNFLLGQFARFSFMAHVSWLWDHGNGSEDALAFIYILHST